MTSLVERTSCPACSSRDLRIVFECPYEDVDLKQFLESYYARYDAKLLTADTYRVNRCESCTLIFQCFVPNANMLEVVYDQWIGLTPATEKPFFAERTSRDAHELLSVASYLKKPLQELRVLDYGMGLGKWCQTAQMLGCQVTGFDLSESRMTRARELGIDVVTWDEIPDLSLDFINTEQVFEHLVEPFEVLHHLAQAVKPGGVIKISVPHGKEMEARFAPPCWMAPKYTRESLNPLLPLEHVNCWSLDSVQKMAERASMLLANRRFVDDFSFLRDLSALPRRPKEFLRAIFRPAYKRWYPHKLYCWVRKST